MDSYPELIKETVLYLGDLHRYLYFYCGLNRENFLLAEEYYIELLNLNEKKAFNQIGILYSKMTPWKSLKFYLRYLTETTGIEKNIECLKLTNMTQQQLIIFNIIKIVLTDFE